MIAPDRTLSVLPLAALLPLEIERPTPEQRSNATATNSLPRKVDASTATNSRTLQMGRFVSVDKVGGHPGNPQSWNRYTYALDNPIAVVDRNGRDPLGAFAGFAIGVGVRIGLNELILSTGTHSEVKWNSGILASGLSGSLAGLFDNPEASTTFTTGISALSAGGVSFFNGLMSGESLRDASTQALFSAGAAALTAGLGKGISGEFSAIPGAERTLQVLTAPFSAAVGEGAGAMSGALNQFFPGATSNNAFFDTNGDLHATVVSQPTAAPAPTAPQTACSVLFGCSVQVPVK